MRLEELKNRKQEEEAVRRVNQEEVENKKGRI